jgi:transcriptional regulator with XRE-family HTH domain
VPRPNPLLLGLGRAVRATREDQGISQEELGLRSGVHRNYIGGIERAERQPTVATLATLAAALDVAPSELLGLAERLAPTP